MKQHTIIPASVLLLLPVRGVSAYTLEITNCDLPNAGTAETDDEAPTFRFCKGGTYCDALDEVSLPSSTGIESDNFTIQIPVEVGYVPTTMEIERPESANNWWWVSKVFASKCICRKSNILYCSVLATEGDQPKLLWKQKRFW